MREHFFVVYDFVSDRRRARFVKVLEKYGVRVQYSIFEFYLTKAKRIEMMSLLTVHGYFKKKAGEAILIVPVSKETSKKIQRYGDTVNIVGQAGLLAI